MPNMQLKRINLINKEIDNPSPMYKMFKRYMNKRKMLTPIPGMNYANHRQKGGHNWEDGMYFMWKYGPEGYLAWVNHQAQDVVRDNLIKHHGSYVANIVEDTLAEFSRPKYGKMRNNFRKIR